MMKKSREKFIYLENEKSFKGKKKKHFSSFWKVFQLPKIVSDLRVRLLNTNQKDISIFLIKTGEKFHLQWLNFFNSLLKLFSHSFEEYKSWLYLFILSIMTTLKLCSLYGFWHLNPFNVKLSQNNCVKIKIWPTPWPTPKFIKISENKFWRVSKDNEKHSLKEKWMWMFSSAGTRNARLWGLTHCVSVLPFI